MHWEEEIYALYLRSQDCLARTDIDAGKSGAGVTLWASFIPMVNESDWGPETEAVPGLHPDFSERRTRKKGEYKWTVEKAKRYLNDVRRNLTDIIRRCEISENGAN